MSKKAQDPPIKKNAFVHKLYTMLNDPKLSHLIWWTANNPENNTFALYPGKEFANALTGYFKHGNVASFVRQLHMYGFHKVSEPNQLSSANYSDKESAPVWEFKHSSGKFKKDDESSLIYIKRRSSSNSSRSCYSSEQTTTLPNHPHNDYLMGATSSPSPAPYDGGYYQQQYVPYYHMVPPPQHAPQHAPPPHHQQVPAPYYPQAPYPPVYYSPSPMDPQHQQFQPHAAHPHPQAAHHPPQQPPQAAHPLPQAAPPPVQPQPPTQHPHPHHQPAPADYPAPQRSSLAYKAPSDPNVAPPPADPTHRAVTPQAMAPAAIHPQHYTPNLQFRKIWESTKPPEASRPRNPSLFDPLAPAPPPRAGSTTSAPVTHVAAPPAPAPPPPPPVHPASPFNERESAESPAETRISVKLPPPSSIHSTGSSLASPHSPEASHHSPTVTVPLPRSIPSSFDGSASTVTPSMSTATPSIPGSPLVAGNPKKPSLVPINSSLHERLRPSLIELHFGSGTGSGSGSVSGSGSGPAPLKPNGALSKPQNDSIGSQSSHNSIFSAKSSLSSISSFKRTSSFGSISQHPAVVENKSSFSISPHDPIPPPTELAQPQATRWSSTDGSASTVHPYYSAQQFQSPRSSSPVSLGGGRSRLIRSLTPPPNAGKSAKFTSLKSPIPRSSSSLPSFPHGPAAVGLRSLTNSPLIKAPVASEDSRAVNKKVSVTSLLEDTTGRAKDSSVIKSIINEADPEREVSSDEVKEDTSITSDGSKRRRLS